LLEAEKIRPKKNNLMTIIFMDINHSPVFYLKCDVSEAVMFPSSGGTNSVVSPDRNPVSEALFAIKDRPMDSVQNCDSFVLDL
jgi:hypothetical protein